MNLSLRFECVDIELDRRSLRRDVRRVLRAVGRSSFELSVLFVDDERIRELNRDYRSRDRSTDVLAFPQGEPISRNEEQGGPPEVLGDVVISLPTARRQAVEYGHSLSSEVHRLVVHGVLHLCGHDHMTPSQEEEMRREERRVLRELSGNPRKKGHPGIT